MAALRAAMAAVLAVSLGGAALAGELPQPTDEEWRELSAKAKKLERAAESQIKSTKRQLKRTKDYPKAAAEIEKRLCRYRELEEEFDNCGDAIDGLGKRERTRDRYLQLRKQLKRLQSAFNRVEWARRDASTAENEKRLIEGIEKELQKHKDEPPGRIPAKPVPKGIKLTWQNFPRIDGSTTAQPLAAMTTCRLLGLGMEWRYRPTLSGGSREDRQERILVPVSGDLQLTRTTLRYGYAMGAMSGVGLRVHVNRSGTHGSYRNLIIGLANLILVARAPSPDELALAKEKQVELDVRPVGFDAFVFLLHKENPITNLAVKQIQDIYQDNVFRWHEIGGKNEPIIAFQRNRNSGSQETMESLVMKGLEMSAPEKMLVGSGMIGPYNLLGGTRNGIGYTFYYYHTYQSPPKQVKICAVDGVQPSPETIQNRTYPFVTEVYAVVRKDQDAQSSAVKLRNWLLTPEGQAVVKESGYVALGVK